MEFGIEFILRTVNVIILLLLLFYSYKVSKLSPKDFDAEIKRLEKELDKLREIIWYYDGCLDLGKCPFTLKDGCNRSPESWEEVVGNRYGKRKE